MAPAEPTALESLPVRPPTPPREADKYVDEALHFLSDSFEVEEAISDAPVSADPAYVNTPPQQSPASSADRPNDSARRKKVDFSPWTAYHGANDIATSRRGLPGSPLRPLPQPRDPRTLKSILKAHDPPPTQPSTPTSGHPASTSSGFATMMETLVKQLAGQSRLHRIDAYMALVTTLKTYDGKPDAKTLADKMGLLAQFMQRDMTATNTQTGGLDVQLSLQAIKLLVALMEAGPVAERIPDTFRTFFLEKAIETFGDATSPKQWVNHILHAFSQQQFGKSMNVDRANRAVTALKDIEDRVSGNNVVICRMMAYRTLLVQQKLVMIDRASDWIQHVFHGLLSSNKDIRMRAVELATVTGISVGKEDEKSKVPRITMDILAKPIDDGRTYGDYFTDRLLEMLSNAETAQHVPHIWASVVLLLKNRAHKFEAWKLLKKWLQVFQKCVNSSNREVAIQANGAWNRFVYAVRPTQHTSLPFRSLLRQALVAQFERKGNDKDAQRLKRSAFSSYCNLLYYSLSPTAPTEQLDLYWQEFVVEVLPTMVKRDRRGAVMACKVLAALFKRNRTKLWRENLAVESVTITLDNIIALNPRWTRQKLGNVLQPFELCFASTPWTCNSPSEEIASESPVKTMWTSLMATVAEAGSKEVTASMDFKEACAHILNLLHRLWTNHPKSLCQDDGSGQSWIDKFSFVVLTAVDQLGPGSFADPILSRNPAGDFEVAPTPSHRSHSRGSLQSPLLHLLHLFTNDGPTEIDTSARLQLSGQLLELCCQAKPSRKSKLELLRNYVQVSTASDDELFKSGIWRHCAQLTRLCLRNSGIPTATDRASQSLGEEYHSVLDILAGGLRYGAEDDLEVASALYAAFVSTIQHEVNDDVGTAAVALAITEPLAERLESPPFSSNGDAVIQYSALLLRHTAHPRHRKTVEQARRTLWGVSTGPQKPSEFDPFNHLYRMIVSRLHRSYEALENLKGDLVIEFSAEVGALFQRWPISFAAVLLRKIQDGIAVWIRDHERKLSGDTDEAKGGREAVYSLWNTVMSAMEALPRHDTRLLKALAALITAGLRSERQRIVNRTVEMWNRSFGSQTELQYPADVEKGLRRLRPIVELGLPGFPDPPSDEEPEPLPTFEQSQEDTVAGPVMFESHGPSLVRRLKHGAIESPAQSDPMPSRRVRASSASNSTAMAKLRHDDSQIDFAPIESSLGGDSMDSQLLTDHQREVRERQHDTAAMFPDISSSPPRPLKNKGSALPVYGKPGQSYSVCEDAEPRSTPLLSLREYAGQQEVPSSSPTPRPRRQGHTEDISEAPYLTSSTAEHLFDTIMPSSPPCVDDMNDLLADPSVIKDSFVVQDRSDEGVIGQSFGDMEELDEDVVAQLVGDVSNLSDTRLGNEQQPSFPSPTSDDGSEPELSSSDIDEEVSQQLENEVIAQALRQSRTFSATKDQTLPDDSTIDEGQSALQSAELSVDELRDMPEGEEGVSSFDDMAADLPQGTAGSFSQATRNKANVYEAQDVLSATEKDTSSIDLPIRASPGKTRSLPLSVPSRASVDDAIVEDTFAAMGPEKGLPNGVKDSPQPKQQTPNLSGKSNKKQSGSHQKRKSLTTIDNVKAKKRSKKDDRSSSKLTQNGNNRAAIDSDSDESVFSNIQANGFSMDKQMDENTSSSPKEVDDDPASDEISQSRSRKCAKPTERTSPFLRASPRLSGVVSEPAPASSRTRKSRLSQPQATEPDVDETQDVTDMVGETPARKRRKGRASRNSSVQKSKQASNPPSPAVGSHGGNAAGSNHSSPRTSFAQAEETKADIRTRGRRRSGQVGGSQAKGEVATQQKKRKRSYDGKQGAGSTAGPETHAGVQAAEGASQGSTAGSGHEGEMSQRPKAQPQSIIQRFKRLLADCKKVVLRQDDVAEIDKIMLEVKREVNAAAQRGDEQSGR
ncbi:telomere length regulator protein [Diplodia corticola]|uniref:Telomere length regulator protein n=1 Tax=Diplodia corticola TaxID=236234 RepID=A0A1J9R8W4_9PEZI|nr:telomere length regulator protein [Diplodia corticola]OJD36610.1 telomere length regulator protein [Diplodia corticola]